MEEESWQECSFSSSFEFPACTPHLLPSLQVRNNLLEPVIQVLVKNGPRYNLLNSAVLEMVEFVRKENVRYIIQHLVEQFWPQLESCDYVGTFAALKLKHEQNQVGFARSWSAIVTIGALQLVNSSILLKQTHGSCLPQSGIWLIASSLT